MKAFAPPLTRSRNARRFRSRGWASLRPGGRRRGEEGAGILEVVVAFTVLVLVLAPIAYLLDSVASDAGSSVQKTTALSLAEQVIETINNNGPPNYPTGTPLAGTPLTANWLYNGQPLGLCNSQTCPACTSDAATFACGNTVTEGSVVYTLSARVDWVDLNGEPDLCSSGTVPQVLGLTVTSKWGGANQISDQVEDSTVINYPPVSVPVNGFIGVQINGEPTAVGNPPYAAGNGPPNDLAGRTWGGAGGRVTNVLVTFTPTSGTAISVKANAEGCAFTEAPPGTYTPTVGPVTNLSTPFVEAATPSTTVTLSPLTVSVNQVTTTTAEYDEGSYVDLNYPNTTTAADGITCPSVGTFQCIVTGQAPSGSKPDGSTGLSATADVLDGSVTNANWQPMSFNGVSRIISTACGSVICVGVGYGSSAGTPPYSAAVAYWNATTPTVTATNATAHYTLPATPVIASLSNVNCPNAFVCFALGATASGPVLLQGGVGATFAAGITWSVDTLPAGTTSLSNLVCQTKTDIACFALATTPGPAVISAVIPQTTAAADTAETWKAETLPSGGSPSTTPTGLSSLYCTPGTAGPPVVNPTCWAIATTSGAPEIIVGVNSATIPTAAAWVADPVAAGTTSLTQLTCTGIEACMAIGTAGSAITIVAGTVETTKQTFVADNLTAKTTTDTQLPTSLSQITCTGNGGLSACLAWGTDAAGGPGVLAGRVQPTLEDWYPDSVPLTLESITQLICPSTAKACVGVGPAGSTASLMTIELDPSTGTQQGGFASAAFAAGVTTPAWLAGVGCIGNSATPTACDAPGATKSAVSLLSVSSLTASGTTWSSSATAPQSGLHPNTLGITVYNADMSPSTYSPAACATTCGSIGPLFPFTSGYSVAAGDCLGEVTAASVGATSVPGTPITQAPTAALPLGLFPFEVVNSSGAPVAGATVSITVKDPNAANSACNSPAETFTFPLTGPDGLTRLAVLYETYTVTVTLPGGAATPLSGTFAVGPSTVTSISSSGTTTSVDLLPAPLVVT